MSFDPGLSLRVRSDPMGFDCGDGVVGPVPEIRTLDAIRPSLLDPDCDGPEELYCIAMDVAMREDLPDLRARNLLFGVVTYQKGRLGREPVRSQGHIHAVSASCGASTCEVYEIWEGRACVYMQPFCADDAGECFAVYGEAGDVIIVPPGWVHATVNAAPDTAMTFGAWCVRDYGFEYAELRSRGGIAWFPVAEDGGLGWLRNGAYRAATLTEKKARDYRDFGLEPGVPIYRQYRADRARFSFVTDPTAFSRLWENYRP